MTAWPQELHRDARPTLLRFDEFELRLAPPALFRNGSRVQLQRQPMKLLVFLASKQGALVSHDEIRHLLWPGYRVDFAVGTHVCIRQIRTALADDAAHPRMIENVPGLGYRFLPAVTIERGEDTETSRLNVARIAIIALLLFATLLSTVLITREKGELSPSPAYDSYARGRFLLAQNDEDATRRSLRFFQAAIARDPDYAPAYVAAAEANLRLQAFPEAQRMANQALSRDANLAAAHIVLGQVSLRSGWQWEQGKRHFEAALEKDERLPKAHQGVAISAMALGQTERALSHMARAHALDPASTLIRADYGWMELVAGNPDHAIELCREALELRPDWTEAQVCLVRALALNGRQPEAIPYAVAIMSSAGASAEEIATVASARENAAIAFERWRIRRYEDATNEERMSKARLAVIHAFVGNRDAALDLLEQSLLEPFASAPLVALDPAFRPMAQDPRYRALLERMNIVPPGPMRRS